MSKRILFPVRTAAVLAVLAVVVVSCGSTTDRPDVSIDSAPDESSGPVDPSVVPAPFDVGAVAAAASFAADSADTARVSPDGIEVDVVAEYFEPVRFDDWTAPDECAFDTYVEVLVGGGELVLGSPLLDGPTGPDDREHDGHLGVAVPWSAPSGDDPGSLLVLVVVFDHDTAVTLTAADSPSPDTQPADGWTPLAVVVPAATHAEADAVDVELGYARQDGSASTVVLAVPVSDAVDRIENLTPAWEFDESVVDSRCLPPEGTTTVPRNEPKEPTRDLFGGIVSEKPELPAPGDQPDDPAAATSEAMVAIRTVYDIYNLYDPIKYGFMDDPVAAEEIFVEAASLQVVEPFIGALDPVFDSMVFTSPTEGSVLYQVGPGYHWEIGRVMLVDGTWRVALGTLCRDLGDAGYSCPGIAHDPRPGPLG